MKKNKNLIFNTWNAPKVQVFIETPSCICYGVLNTHSIVSHASLWNSFSPNIHSIHLAFHVFYFFYFACFFTLLAIIQSNILNQIHGKAEAQFMFRMNIWQLLCDVSIATAIFIGVFDDAVDTMHRFLLRRCITNMSIYIIYFDDLPKKKKKSLLILIHYCVFVGEYERKRVPMLLFRHNYILNQLP